MHETVSNRTFIATIKDPGHVHDRITYIQPNPHHPNTLPINPCPGHTFRINLCNPCTCRAVRNSMRAAPNPACSPFAYTHFHPPKRPTNQPTKLHRRRRTHYTPRRHGHHAHAAPGDCCGCDETPLVEHTHMLKQRHSAKQICTPPPHVDRTQNP